MFCKFLEVRRNSPAIAANFTYKDVGEGRELGAEASGKLQNILTHRK